ncbi:hypothetical protein DV737_g3575, partial [Chaetothyriales sp. CBS 132003]
MTEAGRRLGRDDGDKYPADHRKLLHQLNNNRPEDPGTDQEEYSDDGFAKLPSKSDPARQDDLVGVGVSIGRAQTKMKSLQTPAVEKSRVLKEHDNDYASFSTVTEDKEGETALDSPSPAVVHETPVLDHRRVERDASIVQEHQQLQSLSKADPLPNQRSSAYRAVLGGISTTTRERSSSGSMLTGFKKVLQDLPSITTLKGIPSPFASAKSENAAGQRDRNLNASGLSQTVQQPSESESVLQSPVHGSNVEPLLRSVTPVSAHSRHRANSDSSLYLSRRPTGVSSYDDTAAYAAVSEMTNSRLKAITDALQNSSLRLPKLPSVMSSLRPTEIHEANASGDLTRDNTHTNAQSSRDEQSQPTTLRSIRIAMNKQQSTQHVQNPQQSAHPILAEALSHTEGDVIVLGGYRGSVLRDAKPPHRQLWAPIKLGFNLRSVDLEVGLTREDEERARDKVMPSGILSHIGPIDICRRLLKHLKKCPNTRKGKLRVHDWGYDWRLSPDLLSQQLITFLQGLECNNQPNTPSPKRGALVIAHSLGGLVTRYAVNQRPDLFAGVVYAGVPQHCVNILGPLRNGDDVLLSSRVLTAQVNFTMRTSFALLPEGGRCFFQKDTHERYDIDFFDPKTWEEYRLSPCISSPLPVQPWWQQHRRSIMDSMGSLSESMTAALPSLQSVGKRGSWFGGLPIRDDGSQDHHNSISSPSHRDTGEDLGDAFSHANTAETATATTAEGPSKSPTRITQPSSTTYHTQPSELSSSPLSSMRKPASKPITTTSSSIATTVTIPPAAARAYLKRTLAQVLAFKRALAHREDLQQGNKYPPHAILFGKTVPTVYGARVASREAIQYGDAFDDLAFAAGDGVVLASAAQLPDGYRCVKGGRIETDRGHVGLLGDLEAVGKCIAAVVQARNRGVGVGVGLGMG